MIIDILLGVGYKGGVENVINITAGYLKSKGHNVRIIQFIWLGYKWCNQDVAFYTLTNCGEGYSNDIGLFSDKYKKLLDNIGKPEVIIGTSWPIAVSVARKVVESYNVVIPIYSWMHGSVESCLEEGLGGYDHLDNANYHLAINGKLANLLRNNTSGYVYEVKNAIDTSKIVYSEKRNTKKLAFVGRIAVEKNIPFLLNALKESSPEWSLDIVGDSDEEGTGVRIISEYCKDLGIYERVRFHGWLENPWEILKDNYALVLPSQREGSSLVVVESLMCGMPVIATPTDGIIEKIIPGKNGYLFDFNDKSTFLTILKYIEAGKFSQISAKDCRESVNNLSNKVVLEEFERILTSFK